MEHGAAIPVNIVNMKKLKKIIVIGKEIVMEIVKLVFMVVAQDLLFL